jgi:hypothetical protein
MALNKGQLYERALFRELQKNGKIPLNITTIEQIVGQDITVFNRYGESGIEVKSSVTAAFGSGTLKFDHSKKDSPWKLIETSEEDNENTSKDIMKSIAEKYRIADKVNKQWYKNNGNYYPFYLEESNSSPLDHIIRIPKANRGKQDLEALSEIKISCDKKDISDYYTSKGSYYIQIHNKGLYWLGKDDPLNIKDKISKFSPNQTFIRVRVQPKGGSAYNFSYGLYITGLSLSLENLDRNVNII